MRTYLPSVSFLPIAGLCLFFVGISAETCSANMLPESGMLLHVQPVSGSCETQIGYCLDVVPWTTETGLLEFLIFFQPIYWQQYGGEPDIRAADVELRWPESWELIEAEACPSWGEYWYESYGDRHFMHFSYWHNCDYALPLPTGVHEVFLLGRFVLNVGGPGRVELPNNSSRVTLCHPNMETFPAGLSAEVGVDCEHDGWTCFQNVWCSLHMEPPELLLSARTGGIARDSVEVGTDLCQSVGVYPRADWVSAELGPSNGYVSQLHVTADATGLTAGTYDTLIQLVQHQGRARCLPVIFTVEGASSVEDPSPARATTWGRLKTIYR